MTPSPMASPTAGVNAQASRQAPLAQPAVGRVCGFLASEKGVRLAQTMPVGPCIPVGTQLISPVGTQLISYKRLKLAQLLSHLHLRSAAVGLPVKETSAHLRARTVLSAAGERTRFSDD